MFFSNQATLPGMLLLLSMFPLVHADPLIINTVLHCNPNHHSPRGWCAEAYYYEMDVTSESDPVHYFRKCTKEPTINVTSEPAHLGGDGGMFGILQSHYEIQFTVFTNCDRTYKPALDGDFEHEKCICAAQRSYTSMPYDDEQHIQTTINLSIDNNKWTDWQANTCLYPKAFQDTYPKYFRRFSERKCSWTDTRDQSWSSQRGSFDS